MSLPRFFAPMHPKKATKGSTDFRFASSATRTELWFYDSVLRSSGSYAGPVAGPV